MMIGGVILSVGLFLTLLAGMELGRWLGKRRLARGDDASPGSAAAEGVVFAVLGLLIAFTFTASASRFHERRQLIVQQANALGTAFLRTDLLPVEDRPEIRQCMLKWVRIVLDLPRLSRETIEVQQQTLAEAQVLQEKVWRLTVASLERQPPGPTTPFVLEPLNEWIDLSTLRQQLNNQGMPPLVMQTLLGLALLGSVLLGYGMSRKPSRSPLHMIGLASVLAFSIYVIADLGNPRLGLITIDSADDAMVQVRQSIEASLAPATTQP